jgi:hypothetical protein
MDAVPSGSYLAIAPAAADIAPEASAEMARRYNQWALTGHIDATTGALVGYSAIARNPEHPRQLDLRPPHTPVVRKSMGPDHASAPE